MNILGFNCFGHDSAAALMCDGKVVFAVEEERLNRKKHFGGLPQESIRMCLDSQGLSLNDIDHIGFFWKPSISYSKVPVFLLKYWNKVPRLLMEQRSFTMEENLGMLNYLPEMKKLPYKLKDLFDAPDAKFRFHFLEHHFTHAASAFFCSPFDKAAILTIDGAGEWKTAMMAFGEGNKITKIGSVDTPYSLGAFYQAISRHLGFKLIEGPGKLMGLASYGRRDTPIFHQLMNLVRLTPDGGFKLNMRYFSYHYTRKSGVSGLFEKTFGKSVTTPGNWSQDELDLAAAAQQVMETVIMHMATVLQKRTGAENLCIAGGVGLNSVTNGILAKSGVFKDIFIQPAAGDSGTSLGAALMVRHQILNQPRSFVMESAFLGPGYSQGDYQSALQSSGLPFKEEASLSYDIAAQRLSEGNILGWFQGRMEFGPRALGNRSILASPLIEGIKDTLNARVKFREGFRPFAAIVLEEDCGLYFDSSYPNPYMLLVYHVKPEFRSALPGITHVDGTCRIQTVNAKENPELHQLLLAFKQQTGFGILINTSFNIKGEPIVCTPAEAANSFAQADMDYLVMGHFIAGKPGKEL